MKKVLALLMLAVCVFTLVGCGGEKKEEKASSDKKIVLKLSHVFSPDEQLYKSNGAGCWSYQRENSRPR